MKKIKLAITGCLGRMGKQLIRSSQNNKDFKIVCLTESRNISKKILGIEVEQNTINTFKKSNVIIDFTVPRCTLQVLKIASKLKKRVVIGTTGFSKKEEALIKKYSRKRSKIQGFPRIFGNRLFFEYFFIFLKIQIFDPFFEFKK